AIPPRRCVSRATAPPHVPSQGRGGSLRQRSPRYAPSKSASTEDIPSAERTRSTVTSACAPACNAASRSAETSTPPGLAERLPDLIEARLLRIVNRCQLSLHSSNAVDLHSRWRERRCDPVLGSEPVGHKPRANSCPSADCMTFFSRTCSLT